MFPSDNNNFVNDAVTSALVPEAEIKNDLKFNFIEKKFEVVDGRVLQINDISAIKQWIEKFIRTSLGGVPIYQNTKFGTTIKNVIGWKSLNNGFSESEAQRELSEGLLLNPAIERVTYVDISKINEVLNIHVVAKLKDGTNLDARFENVL